jgi:chemotaxis protein methyltransferase CheR
MSELDAFERLRAALIARTGHAYYADKDKLLRDRVRERLEALGLSSLTTYLQRLEGADGEEEWRALEDIITIGETYFFRYADHFERLRQEILPELIARKRPERALRIWSIGCANGAEAYSVAIVLHEFLGAELTDWRIAIIGGDISERVLAAARAARYSQWALRTVTTDERERYFDAVDARTWALKPHYRAMARFERQNMLDLLTPNAPLQWSEFDLILCRNVLIYFSPEQAVALTRQLRARLAPGGTLLLGHAEATLADDPVFAPPVRSEFSQALAPPQALPTLEEWRPAPLPAAPAPPPAPTPIATQAPSTLDDVKRLADAGAYEAAQTACDALIALQPTAARLYYYRAILRHVSDDTAGAESDLKRALYLDRNFALAHHRLGLLLLGAGRKQEGRRSLMTAARVAAAQPESAPLEEGQGVTAHAFAAMVRAQVEQTDAAA